MNSGMASYKKELHVDCPSVVVSQAVDRLIADRRYKVTYQKAASSGAEVGGLITFGDFSTPSGNNPRSATLRFIRMKVGTAISLECTNYGFQFAQGGFVTEMGEAIVARLQMHVQSILKESRQPIPLTTTPPNAKVAGELEKLSILFDRGSLSAEEFAEAKKRVLG